MDRDFATLQASATQSQDGDVWTGFGDDRDCDDAATVWTGFPQSDDE